MDSDPESRTLWCGNLSDKVSEEILFELFLQAAPLEDLRIPTDKSGRRANYAFVVVKHQVSVDYVIQLLDGTELYDREITVKPRNTNKRNNFNNSNQIIDVNNLMGSPIGMLSTNVVPQQLHNFRDRPYSKPYARRDDHQNSRTYRQRTNRGHYNNRNKRRF